MPKFRWSIDNGTTWNYEDETLPFTISGITEADNVVVEPIGTPKYLYANTAAFIGHSFVAAAVDTSTGISRSIRGIPNFVDAFANGRLTVPQDHLFGYSGSDTPTILANLSTALAVNPGFLFFIVGANDINKNDATRPTAASYLADLQTAFDTTYEAGTMPVAMCIQRRASLTAAQEQFRQDVNSGLRALASSRLLVVDQAELFANSSGVFDSNLTYDEVHPDGPGARIIGKACWDAIEPYVEATPTSLTTVTGNLLANRTLTGSGGTKSGTITGNVPTSWTMQTSGSPSSVVVSTEAATDGGNSYMLVNVTAAGGSDGGISFFQTGSGGPWSSVPGVGSTLLAGAEIIVSAELAGMCQYDLSVRQFGGTTPRASQLQAITSTQILNPEAAAVDELRLAIYEFTVGASSTGLGFYVGLRIKAGKSGWIKIRNPWVVQT